VLFLNKEKYMIASKILSISPYILLGAVVSFTAFTFSVFLPNFPLVWDVLFTFTNPLSERASLIISLYGGIQTNFTFVSATYTILIAILLGINTALIVYLVRKRQKASVAGAATVGMGGLVSGLFGVGCAACGTFILSSILGLFGASWILTKLPFGGEEFGILGVVLLGYTMYALHKKIRDPLVCDV